MRLAILTSISLICFSANAIFTRLALVDGDAGPAGFMFYRSLFAVLILVPIFVLQQRRLPNRPTSALGPIGLLLYMVAFSVAYQSMDAGLGTLILFAVLQLALFSASAIFERRPSGFEVIGALIALGGLAYVLIDGAIELPLIGLICIIIAALGWALFTWAGKSQGDPLEVITISFVIILPFVAIGYVPFAGGEPLTTRGLVIAMISGAITSGLGYVIWYAALKDLTRIAAGIWQLTVPLITFGFGVVILSETITMRMMIGSILVIGGVLMAILVGNKASKAKP